MPKTRSTEEERIYRRDLRARRKRESAGEKLAARSAAPAAAPTTAAKSPRPKPGVHRAAVTRMLKSTGLLHVPEEAPLVELVKQLALELDEGAEGATASRYRAALADVRKVLAYTGRPKSSADPQPPAEEPPASSPVEEPVGRVNSLAAFKESRGIG